MDYLMMLVMAYAPMLLIGAGVYAWMLLFGGP
jgi:hypothetical protein